MDQLFRQIADRMTKEETRRRGSESLGLMQQLNNVAGEEGGQTAETRDSIRSLLQQLQQLGVDASSPALLPPILQDPLLDPDRSRMPPSYLNSSRSDYARGKLEDNGFGGPGGAKGLAQQFIDDPSGLGGDLSYDMMRELDRLYRAGDDEAGRLMDAIKQIDPSMNPGR